MDDNSEDWRVAASAEYAERRNALVAESNSKRQQSTQLRVEADALDKEVAELDRGAEVFGLTLPATATKPQMTFGVLTFQDAPPPSQFKDLALELLKQAYPSPLKAKEIQTEVERRNGKTYHWKTAGMTLFRLAQDGMVRREGHRWFYIPLEDRQI